MQAWRDPLTRSSRRSAFPCTRRSASTCNSDVREELRFPEFWALLPSLFRECTPKKDLAAVRYLLLLLASHGLDTIPFCADHLIRLFALSNSLCNARQAFVRVSKPSLYTWNAIIYAHVMLGTPDASFMLYHSMLQCCLLPDRVMLLSLLKACDTPQSMHLHHHIVSYGFESDTVLASSLASVHANNGALREAYRSFKQIKKRDVVSWGALMTGHIQHGYFLRVLELFKEMQREGVCPDRVIILCILKACSHVGTLTTGRLMHDEVMRSGLETDLAVGNTLIDMYGRSGSVGEAHKVLQRQPSRDVVSWNALFAGYSAHGYDILVFKYLRKMQEEGIKPSKVTYLCTLKACINLAALTQGWLIHVHIITSAYDVDLEVGNSLIDLYAKCGLPDEAYKVFCRLPKHDEVTWGALLAGYAQIGKHELVRLQLSELKQQGFMPNNVMFTSIFAACGRSGRIKEAQKYFELMTVHYKVMPSIENYSCLIDLFGRSGSLDEAQHFFETLPLQPDAITWKSLLTSCQTHGSIHLGQHCFEEAVHLDTEDASNYVLVSKLYADSHLYQNTEEFQEMRKAALVWKLPGRAWVEVDQEFFEFNMNSREHDEYGWVSGKFSRLGKFLIREGHVPHLDIMSQMGEKT
ncbi:hypothetical protein L7F22_027067 [Adiantum nelumboides]|nr:hypothetical protein [Adiantum nelumboides]